jgi:hypothetical protein
MSQTKSQLIEGSAASELTAAKTLLGAGSAGAPSLTAIGDTNTGIFFPTADTIAFAEGGVETVRIDSSGRVGIGTPSPSQKFDLSAGANLNLGIDQIAHNSFANEGIGLTLSASDSDTDLIALGVVDTNKLGIFSREGIVFGAGGATTYSATTERMRLDDSGRLLVGTSSSIAAGSVTASTLQVSQGASGVGATLYSLANASGPGGILVLGHGRATAAGLLSSGDVVGQVRFAGGDGGDLETLAAQISVEVDGTPGANDMPGRLTFSTTADGASSPTERIRLSNAGLSSFYGTLGVIYSRSGTSAGTAERVFIGYHSASSIVTGTISINIFTNGNINNTNNSYTGISDIKLKENIVDASSQWNDLKSLQVRKYNFKEETGHQTHTQLGLIAQEVEEVSPGLVGESPDLDAEGNDLGTVTKSVNYSVLYMKAVKALQEAMERIETLEGMVAVNNITIDEQQHQISALAARLTALESA